MPYAGTPCFRTVFGSQQFLHAGIHAGEQFRVHAQGMLFRQAGSQQFIPSGREKTILDAPLVKNASADSSLAAASQFFPAGKDKITRYGAGKTGPPSVRGIPVQHHALHPAIPQDAGQRPMNPTVQNRAGRTLFFSLAVHGQSKGNILPMVYNPPPCPAADKMKLLTRKNGTRRGLLIKITVSHGRFRPAVRPQHRLPAPFQQSFVHGHGFLPASGDRIAPQH